MSVPIDSCKCVGRADQMARELVEGWVSDGAEPPELIRRIAAVIDGDRENQMQLLRACGFARVHVP